MAEVRWTPQAVEDLESITTFIARDSSDYARVFASDVMERVEHGFVELLTIYHAAQILHESELE